VRAADPLALLLPWIALFPLLTAAVNGFGGKRIGREVAGWIACAGVFSSFVLGLRCCFGLLELPAGPERVLKDVIGTWISAGDLHVTLSFVFDPLSAVMVLVVTGVGFLIHVYSIGYMEHDEDVQRYFAYLNLFTFAMLVLVLAGNLPMMFIGWEGVGLCSYLLIGFWFTDPKNATAGRKAFLVNRVGDFGFLIGMFLVFTTLHTLDFAEIASSQFLRLAAPTTLTIATLCLFLGATGKSAQIPLFVWLPDAMAGPTPVSALIHAATMVTAGVYMICRMSALFVAAPLTLSIVAGVGAITALGAGLIALTQNDIKRVLAYSTISQLGYMFLAAGAQAFDAATFHLFTHAFFKALLFLGAGAVIHDLAGEQDVRRMGGLKRWLPTTYITFLIAAAAIAGIPPLAGFFSKDEILWRVLENFLQGHGVYWLGLWLIGIAVAALTAGYMFRLVALVFFGSFRGAPEALLKPAEKSAPMMKVLVALAGLTAVVGFFGVPEALGGSYRWGGFLQPVWARGNEVQLPLAHGHWAEVLHTALVLGISGLVAWRTLDLFKSWPVHLPSWLLEDPVFPAIRRRAEVAFGVDEAFRRWIVEPLYAGAARLWQVFDVGVIDKAVNGTADSVGRLAGWARGMQTGTVNLYAVVMTVGVILLLLSFTLI